MLWLATGRAKREGLQEAYKNDSDGLTKALKKERKANPYLDLLEAIEAAELESELSDLAVTRSIATSKTAQECDRLRAATFRLRYLRGYKETTAIEIDLPNTDDDIPLDDILQTPETVAAGAALVEAIANAGRK